MIVINKHKIKTTINIMQKTAAAAAVMAHL